MKGANVLLYSIVVGIIIVVILVGYLTTTTYTKEGGGALPTPSKEFEFETGKYGYSKMLLWDSNGIKTISEYEGNFSSEGFCKSLKRAIINAVLTGTPQVVDVINYAGTGLDDASMMNHYPELSICPEEQLNISIGPGVWQDVCKYVSATNMFTDIDEINENNGLDFGNCYFIPDRNNHEYTPDISQMGPMVITSYVRLAKDRFTHYKDASGSYSKYGNGPGRMKIVIGNATVDDSTGWCVFASRYCFQPAIATDENNATLRIFDIYRRLELRVFDENTLPYYIINTMTVGSGRSTPWKDFASYQAYEWTKQTVDLDQPYSISTVINAISSGLNANPSQFYWMTDHTIDFSTNVTSHWLILLPSESEPVPGMFRAKKISINCGADDICQNRLKFFNSATLDYNDVNMPYITLSIIIYEEPIWP